MSRLTRLAVTALVLLVVLAGLLSAYWTVGLAATLASLGVTRGSVDLASRGLEVGALVGVAMTLLGASASLVAPHTKLEVVRVPTDSHVSAGRI